MHAGAMAADTAQPERALAILQHLELSEAEAMHAVQLLDQLTAACLRLGAAEVADGSIPRWRAPRRRRRSRLPGTPAPGTPAPGTP